MAIHWKLRQILQEKQVAIPALAQAMGKKQAVTIYRLVSRNKPPKQVSFETIEGIINALQQLTGETITANDLIELIPEPLTFETELNAWQAAGTEDLGKGLAENEASWPIEEQKEWFEAMEKAGRPARYIPGRGLVVE